MHVAFSFPAYSNMIWKCILDTEATLSNRYVFYMDDFGTRTTCKGATNTSSPVHELSFALGGVIIAAEDVDAVSKNVKAFCDKWEVPELHGHKIRSGKGKFGFLKQDEERRTSFFFPNLISLF
jgi:hypothetical protein